jgi:hypothetical protein
MGTGGTSSCSAGDILFLLCLLIGRCVGRVLLGLVGVGIVIGWHIGVTTCSVDLDGLLLIKVAALAHDLLLLLLLLLKASVWV